MKVIFAYKKIEHNTLNTNLDFVKNNLLAVGNLKL